MLETLSRPILTLIFSFVDQPSELAVSCKAFHAISTNEVVRASWLVRHENVIQRWATEVDPERPTSPGAWASRATALANSKSRRYPETILGEGVISFLISRYASSADSKSSQAVSAAPQKPPKEVIAIRALWSLACASTSGDVVLKKLHEDATPGRPSAYSSYTSLSRTRQSVTHASAKTAAPLTTLTRHGHDKGIPKFLDATSWREVFFCAVAYSEVSQRLMETVLARYLPQVSPFIKDAAGLTCIRGNLNTLHLLMEHPAGDSVLRESGLELLKTAAGNGHRDLVLYLVGRGSFSEHHDGLIKTYRGLHFLLEASEQNALDTVFSTVLEGWRSDDDQQFALRWRMACEMACEHNYQELVRRLLEARAPAEKEDPQMRLKIRMFALALANGHTELAAKLLSWSAEEETDPQFGDALTGKTNMLAGLGTHSGAPFGAITALLKRYCVVPDKDLAPQIGITPSDVITDWKHNIAFHRLLAIQHLCTCYPNFIASLNKQDIKDDLWEASSQGNLEHAKYLKELTGIQIDWMDTASVWSLTGVKSKDLNINATDLIPPAIAMALFETLGGSWSVGSDSGAKASVKNADIGALLVAAEASREMGGIARKLKVSDYDEVSKALSRDASFLRLCHPRMMVNPEDKMWTKFLEGKLDPLDETGNNEGFSWMEPKASSEAHKEALFVSDEELNNPVNIWRHEMGLKGDRENEELSFFLGLGGKMPEKVDEEALAREKQLARDYSAEY